jgi:hypothetical protein
MRILFIGDVSGSPGRDAVAEVLPRLKTELKLDLVIANCENAAGGLGVTREVMDELLATGIDFFTSGDHVWREKEFLAELRDKSLPLVRPYNYESQEQLPGKGYDFIDLGSKGRVLVINLIGQTFMPEHVRNPFWIIDELLQKLQDDGSLSKDDIIFIDFHAEATAEKISLGYYLKNRITALVGTHTHVATADTRMIDHTAYVTDVGMAGPFDASLWAEFSGIFHNFKFPFKKAKQVEKNGRRIFNSVLIETDGSKATNITRVDKVLE